MHKSSIWEVSPGYFGDSSDNIIVIENFVDAEDLRIIQDFCPTIDEWNNEKESVYAEDGTCLYNADYWNDRQCSSEILQRLSPQVWEIVDKYIDKMKVEIEKRFRCKVSKRPPVIMKWRPGTEQRPHADKQLNDGSPNAFPDYDINSLFYYNDDFEGGNLYYPQHGITVRPKPGLAVIHPGDVNYLHGVTMVTSGLRYTTPSFYSVESFSS
jgi:hypothetical protein